MNADIETLDWETRVDTREKGGAGRIGQPAIRPDGVAKVRGEFSFSGDLFADGAPC